jgi:hypothetical protein
MPLRTLYPPQGLFHSLATVRFRTDEPPHQENPNEFGRIRRATLSSVVRHECLLGVQPAP